MKKTFPLHLPGKEDPRVVEAIKLDLTKYVKRERKKKLPPGVDFWHFDCKVGADAARAIPTPLPEVHKAVDAFALKGETEVYVEILAAPGFRSKKPSPYQRDQS